MKNKIIAMRIEEDEYKKIKTLRTKHFINISEFFRKMIVNLYNKMEKK